MRKAVAVCQEVETSNSLPVPMGEQYEERIVHLDRVVCLLYKLFGADYRLEGGPTDRARHTHFCEDAFPNIV